MRSFPISAHADQSERHVYVEPIPGEDVFRTVGERRLFQAWRGALAHAVGAMRGIPQDRQEWGVRVILDDPLEKSAVLSGATGTMRLARLRSQSS